jgi:excisionase family DNA binding protein
MNDLHTPRTPATEQRAANATEGGFYSVSQAAALLGVSRVTLSRWIRANRLPVARLGHRTVRITREDLDHALVESRLTASRAWMGRQRAAEGGAERPPVLGTDGSEMMTAAHAVQFYEADAVLLDAVAAFLTAGLRAGEACIVVVTPAHRGELEERLHAAGLDLDAAHAAGQYEVLDAAETLACFMVDGSPDAARFVEVVGGIIALAEQMCRVRVFGEMVALLAADGNHTAALRLEELWNALHRTRAFALFCAYPLRNFGDAASTDLLGAVCAEHSRVIPTESYAALPTADDQQQALVVLQHKAQRLEAEIAERQRVEEQLREEHQLIETLYHISAAITAELDLATVVQTVTDAATAVLGAAVGALFYNVGGDQGEPYQLYAVSGVPREAFAAFPPPRNTSLLGSTFRGEGVVRLDDVTQDPRFGQNPPYSGLPPGHPLVRSYLAVSVVARSGEVLGGLFFGHPEPGVFSERAERIAGGIAAQAAIALEHARLYTQEQQARATAQQAVEVRDEFLGAVAHDLRSPLTTMQGMAQLLGRQAQRANVPELPRLVAGLETIQRSARKMTAMVQDLLDLSQLEAGRELELARSMVDLVALTQGAVHDAEQTTSRHAFTVYLPDHLVAGEWDGLRLERVLANLLSNAVKYSPDGGTITVRVDEETAAEGTWAVVTVADEGIGIAAEELPHIFERFYRAPSVTGRVLGTGLGLAGARRIVEEHGGTVEVESIVGDGSRFTVRLPRR